MFIPSIYIGTASRRSREPGRRLSRAMADFKHFFPHKHMKAYFYNLSLKNNVFLDSPFFCGSFGLSEA